MFLNSGIVAACPGQEILPKCPVTFGGGSCDDFRNER
ncbi:hypothetical protein FHS40_006848 [Streptomyces spectabilis]|uniref:Uncharacterized protein n=1 Tax=Streptomyces spectabilis TaxID=68270 RepID=A0A7W8AZV1_STRST|nr:hypothetical protein [Streptomyces spectabilis]